MGLGIWWRQDGKELYYLAPKHAVMAADVSLSPALEVGTPRLLFTIPAGKILRRIGAPGRYGQPAISPDGTRIAVRWFDSFFPGGRSDIWVFDVASGKSTPITNDAPADLHPLWSPDGKQIFYVSARAGGYQGIYRKAADGSGSEELIYRYDPGAPVQLRDISPDGAYLTFNSGGVILVLPLAGADAKARKAVELSREEFAVIGGVFSPEGRFIAYGSNETDNFELYVRPFDAASGAAAGATKWRVSKEGLGGLITWRGDGRELYFLDADPDVVVMAADVATAADVQAGTPKVLFHVPGDALGDLGTTKYISRDGQRFVFVLPAPATAATPSTR